MNWQVEYYKKENGDIPVLNYLLTLNPKMRAKAFSEIELLEKHGTDLREPYVKSIKGEKYKELFELRIKFSSDISRIFYFTFQNNTFVLLNGFTKKTNKTPINELDRAIKYKGISKNLLTLSNCTTNAVFCVKNHLKYVSIPADFCLEYDIIYAICQMPLGI